MMVYNTQDYLVLDFVHHLKISEHRFLETALVSNFRSGGGRRLLYRIIKSKSESLSLNVVFFNLLEYAEQWTESESPVIMIRRVEIVFIHRDFKILQLYS
jgi:hypothetical protein